LQLLKLPDGTVKVLVEGQKRAKVTQFDDTDAFMRAHIETLPEDEKLSEESEALSRAVVSQF